MKNILIPTDFTSKSDHAVTYAIDIALQLQSKLHVVYVHEDDNNVPSFSINLSQPNLQPVVIPEIINQKMEQLKNKLALQTDLYFECHIKHGNVSTVLGQLVEELSSELIIIGIAEEKEHQESSDQSLSMDEIKKLKVSVLTVPLSNLKKLGQGTKFVLASDFQTINDWSVMDTFYALALQLNASIDIFYVKENFHQEKDMDDQEKKVFEELVTFFKGIHLTLHHSFKSNVVKAIDEYARYNQVSMVTMIAHERGWLEEIFHASKTKEMQLYGHVPLLTIPEGATVDLNKSYIVKYW